MTTSSPVKANSFKPLHAGCETLLYAWLIGLVLPHTNAFYNLGLFGAPLLAILYLLSVRHRVLSNLPFAITTSFILCIAWSLLSCLWSVSPSDAFTEWRQNMGIALSLSLIYAVIFQNDASQQRLWKAMLLLSATLAVMFIYEWILISRNTGALIPPYPSMRSWGDRLILCFPFLIFRPTLAEKQNVKLINNTLVLVFVFLMLVTGTRGVWISLLGYFVCWAAFNFNPKTLTAISVGFLLIFSSLLFIPNNPLKDRVSKITYASDRINYTWGPAIKFWEESPIFGIGYGSTAFDAKAEELLNNDSEWLKNTKLEDRSYYTHLGPHSNYFEALAGGGAIGFTLLLLFYGQVIKNTFFSSKPTNLLVAATGSGIIAKYMIHGAVETINWKVLGILIGLMLAVLASKSKASTTINQANSSHTASLPDG